MARKKSKALKWQPPPPQEDAATPPEQPLPPPSPPPGWVRLFKKKLDHRDANPVLGQVVIEECWDEMETALAKLVAERRYFCLRVMATDPLNNLHELRFMKYFGGRYALFHKWGDFVSLNNLREGYTVDCSGYFLSDDEIKATLVVNPSERNSSPENQEEMELESPEKPDQETDAVNQEEEVRLKSLQFKHLLKIPIIPEAMVETDQEPEGHVQDLLYDDVLKEGFPHVVEEIIIPTPVEGLIPAVDFLFEKKLDYADVDPDLNRLVFTRCSKRLKTALEESPSIRVSTVDPNNYVEHTPLLFTRYIIGEMYALFGKWGQVVAENGLKEGDTVVGYGNDVGGRGGGEFSLQLYILRDKPSPSDAKREKRRKKDEGPLTLLLLEKDSAAVLGRVVINSTGKELAEVVVAGEVEMEESDEDDGGGFAMFSAEGANGVEYEWSENVGEDGLSKSVGGAVVGDGEFRMKIDVYKSRY